MKTYLPRRPYALFPSTLTLSPTGSCGHHGNKSLPGTGSPPCPTPSLGLLILWSTFSFCSSENHTTPFPDTQTISLGIISASQTCFCPSCQELVQRPWQVTYTSSCQFPNLFNVYSMLAAGLLLRE